MWPGGHFNETEERLAIESQGISYFSAPMSDPITVSELRDVKVVLAKAAAITTSKAIGPVLVHCRSGFRATAAVLAYIGFRNRDNWQWALRSADAIGYSFWESKMADAA